MIIRFRTLVVVVLAVLLAACSSVTNTGDPSAAATVNDEHIDVSAVERQLVLARGRDAPDPAPEELAGLQASALQFLVRLQLLEQGAKDLGVEVTEEDMDLSREQIVENFGGREAIDELLAEQGLELEDLEIQMRSRLLEGAIAAALTTDIEVSEADVRAEYENQYAPTPTVRHILVESADEAEEIIAELEDGADFGELAQERSTDPSAESNAGDLGPIQRGQTVQPFEEAAFNAEVGEIVGPVETQFGFHVIEVTDLEEAEAPPFEEVRAQIRRDLVDQAGGQAAFIDWIRGVATDADVLVNPRFGEWDVEGIAVVPASPLDQ